MNSEKIGIFDSGIGGVTVLTEILKILPKENYIYYSDSKNNPYGDKTQEEIQQICDAIVKKLLEKKCKAIVIACNTASAQAVDFLRNRYTNIPIVAIEPAYKMVYDYAYGDETLVMATKGTIKSEKFNILLNKYDNKKTTLLECVGLADIIEEGNKEKIEKYLDIELTKYQGKVKNVVLGCTHYPLIEKKIKNVLGKNVRVFNGASRLAVHLKDVLEEKSILNECGEGKIDFIDTQNQELKENRFRNYIENIKNIKNNYQKNSKQ